jgi:hypothetical protein
MDLSRRALLTGTLALLAAPPDLEPLRRFWSGWRAPAESLTLADINRAVRLAKAAEPWRQLDEVLEDHEERA